MEINQLIYFRALHKQGSFARAAEFCSISQPSLSTQIKKLELELGETLFTRSRKGCSLTGAGLVFWEQAQQILQNWEDTIQLFSKRTEIHKKILRIGAIPTIAPYIIPQNIDRLKETIPDINIDISEDKTAELIHKVLNGEIAFGICSNLPSIPSGIQVELLFKEPLITIMPQTPHYAKIKRLNELENDSMILLKEGHCLSDQTVSQCRAINLNSIGNTRCESIETLVGLVESDLGYGIIPKMGLRHYRNRNVRIANSKSTKLERQINIIARSDKTFDAQEKLFIQSIMP